MDLFVNSDFNSSSGTLLEHYTDLAGNTWTKLGADSLVIGPDKSVYATGPDARYAATATSKSGYYTVEWDFVIKTASDGFVFGMWDVASNDHYAFGAHMGGAPKWEFVTVTGGFAGTQVIDASWGAGETHHVVMRLKAGVQQITVDGNLLYSGTDENVYKLGAVGISLFTGSATTGVHIANLKAYLEDSGDPFPLTGTQIAPMPLPSDRLRARSHRRSAQAPTLTELWVYRDGAWALFPQQPIASPNDPILLTQTYKEPSTLELTIPNPFGTLTPTNLNSQENTNLSGEYDALIEETRQILLRVGTRCYPNLAAGIAPTCDITSGGSLSLLTDGNVSVNGTGPSLQVDFIGDGNPRTISIDLGSLQSVRHLAAVLMSSATQTWPEYAQWSVSNGTRTWTFPKRPVGGDGGDWDNDSVGAVVDFIQPDVNENAPAVRYIHLTLYASDSRTVGLSEIAVYGGDARTADWLGANLFTGYIGDDIQVIPEGKIRVRATDTLKRLADNAEIKLSNLYKNKDLADIAWDLLTNSAYWPGGTGNYSAPIDVADIAWNTGQAWTNFPFPRWQGQSNTVLGYLMELWQSIGWHLFTTGSGRLNAIDPPVAQYHPNRVCVASIDSPVDVWNCVRHYDGKDLRNVCHVATAQTGNGAVGDLKFEDPNSIAKYGRRSMFITDALANTANIRTAIAAQVVREYAWRLGTLQNSIYPDYETAVKQIFGFRADYRPQLFSHASTVPQSLRAQELWSLEGIQHNISYGYWVAHCDWRPYFPILSTPPAIASVASGVGLTTATLTWSGYSASYTKGIRIYYSQTSETGPFIAAPDVSATATSYTISGLTSGQPVWVYVVAIDSRGYEGTSSSILTTTVGASPLASASLSGWKVTDLAIGFDPTTGLVGPDATGAYTYEFVLRFSVPAAGMTRFGLYYSLSSAPADTSRWIYADEWHGPLVSAGQEIQAPSTAGTSLWYARLRNTGAIASGTPVYFRLVTYTNEYSATSPQNSNDASVVMI